MNNFLKFAKKGYKAFEDAQKGETPQVDENTELPQAEPEDSTEDPPKEESESSSSDNEDQEQEENEDAPEVDHDEAVNKADEESGGSGNKALFTKSMKFIKKHKGDYLLKPLNEEHVNKSHKEAYEKKNGKSLDANSMGEAAALQAYKTFTAKNGSAAVTAGGSTQLISLAMSEASKLFESSGGAASGGKKQDVVNSAAMTTMKLAVKSKMGGVGTGGSKSNGGSSGLGSLMGMAKKVM